MKNRNLPRQLPSAEANFEGCVLRLISRAHMSYPHSAYVVLSPGACGAIRRHQLIQTCAECRGT